MAGAHETDREAQPAVRAQVTAAWGAARWLHRRERGLAGAGGLGSALDQGGPFGVRGKKGTPRRPADAPSVGPADATPTQRARDGVAAWRLTAGRRNWGERPLPQPRHPGQPLTVRGAARPGRLGHRDAPRWLGVRVDRVARHRGGSEPWRRLPTAPGLTEAPCGRLVEAYGARWTLAQQWRGGKRERGLARVRGRDWAARPPLFARVALPDASWAHLLGDGTDPRRPALVRWAHRTGAQARDRGRPRDRRRRARAALWARHPPTLQGSP